jgi:AcrR family transcriptional regulator
MQARTRESWARVLDAGVALLEDGGYGALTIAALCERAAVTPPTIYARAGSKEQLLLAVYERAMERVTADDALDPADPRWAAMAPTERVRAAVGAVARVWLRHARLLRAIVHRAATDEEVFRRGAVASRDVAARFRAIVPAAEREADACFRVVYAALVQRVVYGPGFESDVRWDEDGFTTMLGDVAVRYLGITEERP